MNRKPLFTLILLVCITATAMSQVKHDQATFQEIPRGKGYYYETILKDVRAKEAAAKAPEVYRRFIMDQAGYSLPAKKELYKSYWHGMPVSQGNTNTCWCFSTISFYESEVYRLQKKEVRLSEMFIVYYEYIEKAREYVRTRGKSNFPEGSEANAVTRMFGLYGAMPLAVYSGLPKDAKFHSHDLMHKEMVGYLESIKASNNWNEKTVLETIKSIMDYHIGTPPETFTAEGKTYTPKTYMADYLKLVLTDYVEVLSYMQEPYFQQVEYSVPDNWWHSKEYYNVPLDIYMQILKSALEKGYTTALGGDVSEPGLSRETQCAMIPTFDIPSEYIDESARQFRFSNQTTTDDHGMHVVGYHTVNGKTWYLLKDSGSGSRNNDEKAPEFGYLFFHEDYIKLKMMNFTVHKDIVKPYLKKVGN